MPYLNEVNENKTKWLESLGARSLMEMTSMAYAFIFWLLFLLLLIPTKWIVGCVVLYLAIRQTYIYRKIKKKSELLNNLQKDVI